MWLPILLLGSGVAALIILATSKGDRPVPDHPPDYPPTPGKTGHKLVDKILPQLAAAAQSSDIPLGLLVGWVVKESGGKIGEVTSRGERGFFQLDPSEAKKVGYDDLDRLSSDVVYSINAGLALIGVYMGDVDRLNLSSAPKGSSFYWKLVKLMHTVGPGAAKKWVQAGVDEGVAGSWESLRRYLTAHDSEMLHATKHSPLKWLPFIDEIYAIGAPFGFGSGGDAVVGASPGAVPGGPIFADIVDPLDCL